MEESDLPREAQIVLETGPVSLQGGAAAKELVREAVRRQAELFPRIFVREVAVDVEWLLHESRKWGTPGVLSTPDMDNILKPLLDGLCGPRGILIDDCQIQTISCGWIDWGHRDRQQVTLRVRSLMADEWIPRGPIVGVEAPDGACWPMRDDGPAKELMILVRGLVANRAAYSSLLAHGVPEEDARYALAQASVFHRAHFERHGFVVVRAEDYLNQLEARVRAPS
jgi:Holliday junction resolvase RusA-like endonuclease